MTQLKNILKLTVKDCNPMTQPFCCDITSGTKEEQNEFKRLFDLASNKNWGYGTIYYGVDKYGVFDCGSDINYVINFMSKVFPISEGISILKKMVGEEEKKELNEHGLLPCPFCGGNCLMGSNGNSQYVVKCYTCSVTMLDDRKDKVVANWNKRQPKPTE